MLAQQSIGDLGGLMQFSGVVFMLPATIMLYTFATTCSIWTVGIGHLIVVGIPMLTELGRFLVNGLVAAPTLLDPVVLVALAGRFAVRGATQRRRGLAEEVNERLATAQVVEWQRITAEMYVAFAHSLSTMVALEVGVSSGREKHPERSAQALVKLGDVGRAAPTEMQRILQVLREDDPVLDDELHRSGHNVRDLEELVDVYHIAGLPVRLSWKGRSVSDGPVLITTVYRMVDEALTDSLRCANGATRVEADIEVTRDEPAIRVTDNGFSSHSTPAPLLCAAANRSAHPVAVSNAKGYPGWQGLIPNPTPRWVLSTPGGPSRGMG